MLVFGNAQKLKYEWGVKTSIQWVSNLAEKLVGIPLSGGTTLFRFNCWFDKFGFQIFRLLFSFAIWGYWEIWFMVTHNNKNSGKAKNVQLRLLNYDLIMKRTSIENLIIGYTNNTNGEGHQQGHELLVTRPRKFWTASLKWRCNLHQHKNRIKFSFWQGRTSNSRSNIGSRSPPKVANWNDRIWT